MQMTRNTKLLVVLTLLALLTVIGWTAAGAASFGSFLERGPGIQTASTSGNDPVSGDPDTPQVNKRLGRAPDSDALGGWASRNLLWTPGMGRVWVSWYLSRWVAR
jgi:hypothetical protein